MHNYFTSGTSLVILNIEECSAFSLWDIMTFILHLILPLNPPPSLKDAELELTLLYRTTLL